MGGLSQMKYTGYGDYHPDDTARSESALLTIWPRLADFHDDLVLIGGLVPRYICRPRTEDALQPHSLDVDFGIALAAGGTTYAPLSQRLTNEGFEWKRSRFEKEMKGGTLYVDFLTERLSETSPTSVQVDDINASAFFGIDRALSVYRQVLIEGKDLNGANVRETVKVCEVGPFLCLKLQSYGRRAEPKDLFDTIYTVFNYDGGIEAAVAAFKAEEEAKNLAFPIARRVLQERFNDEQEKGPRAYATFCESGMPAGGDAEFTRDTLAADAVTAAQRLLA
jgi:hypothetical protein